MRRSGHDDRVRLFQELVIPNLDAGYNLARWLLRRDDEVDDILQEASIKAFRFVDQCRGEHPRAWFLAIVRNATFSWIRTHRRSEILLVDSADLEFGSMLVERETPETILREGQDLMALQDAIRALPLVYREALILREQENMSYKQMADVTGVPIGTVMSRLIRARRSLAKMLDLAPAPMLVGGAR